jgi:hypothetical protein
LLNGERILRLTEPQSGLALEKKLAPSDAVGVVSAKLKEPITADRKFEDVVKSAQDAVVLVLVY